MDKDVNKTTCAVLEDIQKYFAKWLALLSIGLVSDASFLLKVLLMPLLNQYVRRCKYFREITDGTTD